MKEYMIIIGENNKETSRKVQEELLKAGFAWGGGGTSVQHTNMPVLYLNCYDRGSITFGQSSEHNLNLKDIRSKKYEVLLPSHVLGKAHELDGAKEEVIEVTLADLEEKYGKKVKVVK